MNSKSRASNLEGKTTVVEVVENIAAVTMVEDGEINTI